MSKCAPNSPQKPYWKFRSQLERLFGFLTVYFEFYCQRWYCDWLWASCNWLLARRLILVSSWSWPLSILGQASIQRSKCLFSDKLHWRWISSWYLQHCLSSLYAALWVAIDHSKERNNSKCDQPLSHLRASTLVVSHSVCWSKYLGSNCAWLDACSRHASCRDWRHWFNILVRRNITEISLRRSNGRASWHGQGFIICHLWQRIEQVCG